VNLAAIVMGPGGLAEAEGLLRAVESGSPQWAPRAAFNLGGVLAMQGRNDEAEAAFRRAVDSGHPDDATGALTYLAALWFRTGRLDESERAYRRVLATGHPEFAPLARAGLDDIRRRRA
jgi:tetratricopeptide (TPR) repeat protein